MNRTITKMAILCLSALLAGCSAQAIYGDPKITENNNAALSSVYLEPTPALTQTQQVLAKQSEPTIDTFSADFVYQYLDSEKVISADQIPCYDEQELLFESNCFSLGMDGAMENGSFLLHALERIVKIFPNYSPREKDDYFYLVYNTNKDTRLFLFFSMRESNGILMSGFPIIMKERLSYQDFKGIRVSDTITEVEKIDLVIPLYIANFNQFFQ